MSIVNYKIEMSSIAMWIVATLVRYIIYMDIIKDDKKIKDIYIYICIYIKIYIIIFYICILYIYLMYIVYKLFKIIFFSWKWIVAGS